MTVQIDRTSKINDSEQWVYLTVNTKYDVHEFLHTAPQELHNAELQEYVDDREDFYVCEIYRNMYPHAPPEVYNGSREKFEEWIETEQTETDTVPWTYAHPKGRTADGDKISADTWKLLDDIKPVVTAGTVDPITNITVFLEKIFGRRDV